MMALLILKSKLKNFYEKHYHVVRRLVKFCLVFSILLIATSKMNYSQLYGGYPLIVGIAVICAVTPDLISLLAIVAVVLAEVYQISPLLAVALSLLLVIYYLIFGRLTEKQGIVLVAVPVLSAVQLGYLVPIVAGLFLSPVIIPALLMGIFIRFILEGVQEYALVMSRVTEEPSPFASLEYLLEYLRGNSYLVIILFAFLLTFVCVYLIRRTKIQYASQIAILVGAILVLSVLLLGNIVFDLEVNLWSLIISILVSVVIAYIVQFFHMALDYQGTRKLQFEDDEYYYYVTAVPKYKVAVVDKTLTRIVPDEDDENLDLKSELEKALEEEEIEKMSER